MPEFMPFLLRQGRHDEFKAIVARLEPGFRPTAEDRYVLAQADKAGSAPVLLLFRIN
jgi:MFS transporter, AAHS family, benzoate transport protein